MFYSLQFLILLFYFLLKLYYLVDKFLIFSSNGTKLEKYISNKNLLGITGSFENTKTKKSLLSIYSMIKSPFRYKNLLKKVLVSSIITIIYIAVIYNHIFSNYIFISFFNKVIYLNDIFGSNLIYFQIFYIFLITFFIFNLVNKISNFFNKIKTKETIEKQINEDISSFYFQNNNENIIKIPIEGMFQNVLITGSIGSGKTSSAITNFLDYMFKNKICGVIIDVKGNYIDIVRMVAKKYNNENILEVISLESKITYNPLDRPNISADELSARLVKALELISINTKNSDSFWMDKVKEYIKDFIVLIRSYRDFVSFDELHKLTIDEKYLREKIDFVEEKILKNLFSDYQLFEIINALNEIKLEYLKLDDRTLNIIRSEITRITSPFMTNMNVNTLFNRKQINNSFLDRIVVLSLNIGENKNLAKIISTYLKLDFQSEVLSRKEKNTPVFFICDEYQEFANKEDANFFSISREYKCINIVSMQSYSSLINTLNDEYSARVIIQNLINKVWFRNDDTYTISEIIKQIGKEKKDFKSVSISENSKESRYNLFLNKFKNIKSNLNESYSISQKDDYVLNEEYFSRTLNTFEAALLISDGSKVDFIKKVKLKRWEEN